MKSGALVIVIKFGMSREALYGSDPKVKEAIRLQTMQRADG